MRWTGSRRLPGRRVISFASVGVAVALGVAGCSDPLGIEDVTTVDAISGTSGLTAEVGTAVASAPGVTVRSEDGKPIAGVAVTFAITTGGGTLTDASATTNDAGEARAGTWVLGQQAGANSVTATVGSLTATFTATGTAGAPASLTKIGDGQSAPVHTAVTTAPGVTVKDQFGNLVQGAAVNFIVTAGGGTVTGSPATTNASGEARAASWTLGDAVGANTLTASVGALTTTIGATGLAAGAASLTKVGDGQTAAVSTAVPLAPGVIVKDAFGNLVQGATVTFTVTAGGGNLGTTTATSNAAGLASAVSWTLGTALGANTMQATTTGVGAPAVFTATATSGGAAQFTKTGDAQTAVVNTNVAGPISVIAKDQFGNLVVGATVTFAVTAGGGSVTGGTAVTDATGKATLGSWKLGTTAGGNTLTVTSGTASTTFTATGTAGAAAALVLVSGDLQTDTVQALLQPPTVAVQDQFGNGVANVIVTYAVLAGAGTVNLADTTDATGQATAAWSLGPFASLNSMRATATGIATPVTFTATAEWPPFFGTAMVGGSGHSCGIQVTGRAFCWGANASGQLGNNTIAGASIPVQVINNFIINNLDAGATHTCGITSLAQLFCWGDNTVGQLGDGTTNPSPIGLAIGGGQRFKQVTAGVGHTCAIDTTNAAYCWGDGTLGQLGNGSASSLTPAAVTGGLQFTAIAAGDNHTCGISGGTVYCWGTNTSGQIGDGTTNPVTQPTAVSGGRTYVAVTAGTNHSCAIETGGQLYCWGANSNGSLGDGTSSQRLVPTASGGALRFAVVSAGASTTCGITTGSVAYCWGDNAHGQLGRGTAAAGSNPTPGLVTVPTGVTFSTLGVGQAQVCALATGSKWGYCWGQNANGELGDGTVQQRTVPTKMRGR